MTVCHLKWIRDNKWKYLTFVSQLWRCFTLHYGILYYSHFMSSPQCCAQVAKSIKEKALLGSFDMLAAIHTLVSCFIYLFLEQIYFFSLQSRKDTLAGKCSKGQNDILMLQQTLLWWCYVTSYWKRTRIGYSFIFSCA